MAVIKYRSKNEVNIKDKPRVYFTCHPDDLNKHLDKVCEDIFKTQDCVIYYTENMSDCISEPDRDVLIGQNNLVVIPVTFKLLTTPNRAMDEDLVYALKEHIPVLPIIMESGIDEFYARGDKFGELQYLNPYSGDTTEIAYEDKLEKFLASVLINSDLANRVRTAFDAYIFLSYRKKDRNYANQLMRLIHNHPECRDIAVWYDEFLTPGESFKENINKILCDSKLFTLLVTPNLLEEPNGKPNYVMAEEYPAALQSGISILPAEMELTDKEILNKKFKGIPTCVDPRNEQEFKNRLVESICKIVKTTHNEDPVHAFLIGLAYIDGIDVEVDRERGLKLIISAAEAELPEAMSCLRNMYYVGKGVRMDYIEAGKWALKLADLYKRQYGTDHPTTIEAMQCLADINFELGDYEASLKLNQEVYDASLRVFGEEKSDTLIPLCRCVHIHCQLGNYVQAFEQCEKIQLLCERHLGEEHPVSIESMRSMMLTQIKLGRYREALELCQKELAICLKTTGNSSIETLIAQNDLSSIYTNLEEHQAAKKILEEILPICKKELGVAHPITLTVMGNLGANYSICGDGEKALEIATRVLEQYSQLYGQDHPYTLLALSNSAQAFEDVKEYSTAKTLQKAAYEYRCKVLGNEHPDVIISLARLSSVYSHLKDYENALSTGEKAYALSCKVLGDLHTQTIKIRDNLACYHDEFGDKHRSLELYEKAYLINCKLYGKAHEKTIKSLHMLSHRYHSLGLDVDALRLLEDTYSCLCEFLGETHILILRVLDDLTYIHSEMDNLTKALNLWQHAYDVRLIEFGEDHSDLKWIQKKMDSQKRWSALKHSWKKSNCCQHCGNKFIGLFKKRCRACGKPKDY